MLAALAVALEMTGPRATAFAEICATLQHDDPSLVCERVRQLRVAGHPVEIWRTTSTEIDYFVAIETQAGWYLSDAALSFEPDHEGEHCSSSSRLTRFVTAAGAHAARVELAVDWDSVCPVSDYDHHYGRTYRSVVCVVDDALVPRCDSDAD